MSGKYRLQIFTKRNTYTTHYIQDGDCPDRGYPRDRRYIETTSPARDADRNVQARRHSGVGVRNDRRRRLRIPRPAHSAVT